MNPSFTAWFAAGAMLLCAGLSQFMKPMPVPPAGFAFEAVIPKQFGEWQLDPAVVPVAPTPDVQARLDVLYSQIVSRTYVGRSGERVMLVVAYGGDQSDSLKAHRQEVCYQAQGFEIRNVHRDAAPLRDGSLPMMRVHAQKGDRSEPMSYWFTMGDQVAIGRIDRLITQVRYGLAGALPDGLLVRVSSIQSDTKQAYATQDRFVRALLESVTPTTRARLAGSGA